MEHLLSYVDHHRNRNRNRNRTAGAGAGAGCRWYTGPGPGAGTVPYSRESSSLDGLFRIYIFLLSAEGVKCVHNERLPPPGVQLPLATCLPRPCSTQEVVGCRMTDNTGNAWSMHSFLHLLSHYGAALAW